jgi:hypothetical protein
MADTRFQGGLTTPNECSQLKHRGRFGGIPPRTNPEAGQAQRFKIDALQYWITLLSFGSGAPGSPIARGAERLSVRRVHYGFQHEKKASCSEFSVA